ncbi:MAG TPA: ATP-grasp domain-containing protein [Thermoanaerobaculia bacterium]|jgi:D-alanine-D-alanine ligase|nr:ATP-grasp domain-containing protein [Thermoanaerobaculia bacterium]
MTTIVLFGGPSDERHVSVASAQAVARTLGEPLCWFWAPNGAVHDVSAPELIAHQRPFELDFLPTRPAIFPDLEQALDTLPVEDPVFLLALHGTGGEDGGVQRLMEARGIPFTGSGSAASEAAFDKGTAKERVAGKVRTAESRIAKGNLQDVVRDLLTRHERLVLKPLAGGSSRGLYFVGRDDEVPPVDIPYIVEQFVAGRELTVGVIDGDDGPLPLPVIEIEVDPGHAFDYLGKYLGKGTREICPANIPDPMRDEAQRTALAAHTALGCEGYSRTDMIASADGVYFLELNTLPGLTSSSLVPQQLREAGIDFRHFLERQLELARFRAAERQRRVPLLGYAGNRAEGRPPG